MVLILSLSAPGSASHPSSSPPSAHNQSSVPMVAVPRSINTGDLEGPVNPFIDINLLYSQEPAPMGIADYGVGPSGAYQYSTNSSLGSVGIVSLSAQNSTGYPWMSIQLNVNLQFSNGGKQFVYWVQDVADVDTSTNTIYFVDNIWNSSAAKAFMASTGVQGSGHVAQAGSSYFYYDEAGASLAGNGVNLAYPSTVDFRVNSSVSASKQPVVTFEYNDGYGWQVYDSVAFIAVHSLTAMAGFLVDGFAYNPVNFYDSELIVGGPGGGTSTTDTQSDLRLQLEYWNGHNYQLVTNAYDFGSDTAEGIQNTVSQWEYYPVNGGVIAEVKAGAGSLGKLWDQSGVGVVDLRTSVATGTLHVRNASDLSASPGQYPFKNSEVTVTLEPGSYQFQVYAGAIFVTSGVYPLAAGQLLQLKGPLGVVPFTLSYSVVGGGAGYSPPTLTYKYNGAVQTTPLGTTPTVYNLDAGSTWSVTSQLLGSGATERWETSQATNGTAVPGNSVSITYYHQYLETVSYSVGGGSGYSPPALSGVQFGAVVSLPVGTSPASYWLDGATAYSVTDPLPGSTSSERWFSPGGQGSVGGPGAVVFAYDHQFYLDVSGGAAASQWYDSGAQASVSEPIAYDRNGGTGQRVVSYSVDGGTLIPVAPALGNVTVAVTMGSTHTVAFASVTQDQVTLGSVAPQELDSMTPPTISGDGYWYDSGSVVNVKLYGVWGRSAGEGERLASYSLDGGAQVLVSSKGPVTVLSLNAISSPETVAAVSTAQFLLGTGSGSLLSITPTPIVGDAGWYDNQTAVEATYNYSWGGTAGQSRLNAVSYSVDGGQSSPLSRGGNGTFVVSVTMGAPHQIGVTPVTQYLFTLSGGFDVTLSSRSPTGDGFFDANSSTTVTSSYVGNLVPDKQRQALTGYVLDSRTVSIPPNDTGFTSPPISFDTYHSLAFQSVTQYFVAFAFTDSSGSTHVSPSSLKVEQGGLGPQQVPGSSFFLWVDNGTAFTISSLVWEGADVKPLNAPPYQAGAPENITVKARIYSASMRVTDPLGLAVQGAEVSARLANGTTVTRTTNSNGVAALGLIPIGTYQASVWNLGVPVSATADASVQGEAKATVPLSPPVLGALVVVAAILGGSLLLRRSRRSNLARSGP